MKHIIICTALLIISTISFSQTTNPTLPIAAHDYLQKSKKQKTTALILAGGGVVLEIAGVIAYQHGNAGLLLFGAGLLSQAVSIPFLISAAINKKKSKKASLSFKLEKTPHIQLNRISFRSNPEISLKLNL